MESADAIRGAARWFGAGLVTTPILDIANDRGLLNALGGQPALLLEVPWIGWVHLLFFTGIGICAAWLMRRLDARWRQILFWGSVVPLFAYALSTGLTISVVAGALVLCFAFVQLRFAGEVAA